MAQSAQQLNWQKHIRAWQESGLSQAAYCQAKGISKTGFYYWRKRIAVAPDMAPKVIPVLREPALTCVQLRSPAGWVIALPATLDVASLRAIVAALP